MGAYKREDFIKSLYLRFRVGILRSSEARIGSVFSSSHSTWISTDLFTIKLNVLNTQFKPSLVIGLTNLIVSTVY